MRRGRPQLGSDLVDHLDTDAITAERLRAILATIKGDLTSAEAAAHLGLTESAFHKLRRRCLDGMVTAAAGSAPGRPPKPPSVTPPEEVAAMQQQINELKFQLEGARLREEISLLRPDARRMLEKQMERELGMVLGSQKKRTEAQGAARRRKKAAQKQRRARRA